MAPLIRAVQRSLCSSRTLINGSFIQSRYATSPFQFQSRPYARGVITKSPLELNVLRILRNEIEYQQEYAPPHLPATEFKSFTVEDHPAEQWITLRGKFGEDEHIKMEATMFDGFVTVPRVGEDQTGHDVRLHISLLVDISKGEDNGGIEFVCSAWPDRVEIQKVYMLRRDRRLRRPCLGPAFRDLKDGLQKTFLEYLQVRGINDELSAFLHEYMMNKDRIELIRWLGNVESFVEK